MITDAVYFADMRAGQGSNLLDKTMKLLEKADLRKVVKPNDLVAIKLHFGERGNTSYIRPQFLRRIVNRVKNLGGKPFLTDANTLYVGSRSNAVEHLQTAVENGFAYAVVDAPLIIADGLNGKDYVTVEVNRKHFKEVKIASAGYHADALIVVTHFKGHEITGFGGTLKNIGMGLGCRSGKQMMHSDILPVIDRDKCQGCMKCSRWCPTDAIAMQNKISVIDEQKCIGCGECTVTCPYQAIAINWRTEPDIIQEKIVEYADGVLKNKKGKAIFIAFITDVSPECDCYGWNDAPLIKDVGILVSRDPVALDQACIDLVNKEQILPNSRLAGQETAGDLFRTLYPSIDWSRQLSYGEEIGLGKRTYKMLKI